MKLNTEEWKEFRIGDWFEVLSSNKIYHAANLHIEDKPKNDYYPYVVRSAQNRGIKGYIKKPIEFLNSENTISFAQDTFFAFYQEKPYFTGNNVKILKPLFEYSRNILLFIETSINKSMLKNTWGMGSGKEYVENIEILLPSKNNEPDWDFMEGYIKEMEERYIKKVDKYNQSNIQKALDITGIAEDELDKDLIIKPADRYEEFKIDTLFKKYHGSRLRVEDRKEGNIPFITAGEEGRGVKEYISNHRSLYNNPITIDMFGNTFYHNLKLDGDDNIYFLINDELSAGVKLYISTVLNKVLTQQHSYAKQFRQKKLDRLTAVLPAIDKDTPDFEYMEKAIYIY